MKYQPLFFVVEGYYNNDFSASSLKKVAYRKFKMNNPK